MILISFFMAMFFGTVEFDINSYTASTEVTTFLEGDFEKVITSEEDAFAQISKYMDGHFDKIDMITGNFNQAGDMNYYAVYGSKSEDKEVVLLHVDKDLYKANAYYESSKTFMIGLPRVGIPNPPPNVCPPQCRSWPYICLGAICY